ncbi:restriction endonuclease [Nocardia sp. CA-107356]|uniref:restriction endonuclease n=1 Tax=Nocardia sp. CA-107356 TaxID=3239972 RepID=UPI003D915CA1
MLDLDALDWQTFEALAVLLLRREGFELSVPDRRSGGDGGVDAIGTAPDGAPAVVIIKQYAKRAASVQVARHVADVATRLRLQSPEYGVFYVASQEIGRSSRLLLDENKIRWWGRPDLHVLLDRHPDIAELIEKRAEARDLSDLFTEPEGSAELTFERKVTERLASVPLGKPGWTIFEKLAAQSLTEIFVQHLDPPTIQTRTEDGLDIMDAIFDIPETGSSWAQIRADYQTYFVVAEFKNYSDEVSQNQVNQLADYLWSKAFRMFGLLVSRKGPNDSGLAARRRAWVKEGKLIAFLSDEDLIEMARLVDDGKNPFDVIRYQVLGFFRTLNP